MMKNHISIYILFPLLCSVILPQAQAQYINFNSYKSPDLSIYKKNYHGLAGISESRTLLKLMANDTVPRLYVLDYVGAQEKAGELNFANYFKHSIAIEPPSPINHAVQRQGYTFIFCKDAKVYIYDANYQLVNSYEVLGQIDVNEDATVLASRNMKEIMLYEALTGKEIKRLTPQRPEGVNSFQLRKVSFAPGGDYLMARDLFSLYYWDVHTGEQLGFFHVEGVGKSLVDFSCDAQALQCAYAYYYEKGKKSKKFWGYKVFSLETGKVTREMEWEEDRKPTGISMDPTGSIFAITLEEENGFLFFATDKLKEDETLAASKSNLEQLASSKNGKHSLPTKFHFHSSNPFLGYVTIANGKSTQFQFCRVVYTGKEKDQAKVFGEIPAWRGRD